MASWRCIKLCGACCYLEPAARPDLDDYLSPEEVSLYLSLVREDGWCVHFDHRSRECQIYQHRPRFCRVEPDNFQRMYGIAAEEFDEFAIDCCHQQIASVYGRHSREMGRYRRAVG